MLAALRKLMDGWISDERAAGRGGVSAGLLARRQNRYQQTQIAFCAKTSLFGRRVNAFCFPGTAKRSSSLERGLRSGTFEIRDAQSYLAEYLF